MTKRLGTRLYFANSACIPLGVTYEESSQVDSLIVHYEERYGPLDNRSELMGSLDTIDSSPGYLRSLYFPIIVDGQNRGSGEFYEMEISDNFRIDVDRARFNNFTKRLDQVKRWGREVGRRGDLYKLPSRSHLFGIGQSFEFVTREIMDDLLLYDFDQHR
jgi:hypothetical protein